MVLQVPEADPLTHADVNVVNVVDPCAVARDTTTTVVLLILAKIVQNLMVFNSVSANLRTFLS